MQSNDVLASLMLMGIGLLVLSTIFTSKKTGFRSIRINLPFSSSLAHLTTGILANSRGNVALSVSRKTWMLMKKPKVHSTYFCRNSRDILIYLILRTFSPRPYLKLKSLLLKNILSIS
jgi:hypothetical protein